MLTSLNRLIGLPVVWQDQQMGYVEKGVPDQQARRLLGVVVRRGLHAAKWIPSEGLKLVGRSCVLARVKPAAMPEEAAVELKQAYLTSGERIGRVNDGVLNGQSLQLLALEISAGPFYSLMGQSVYARQYRMILRGEQKGHVVVNSLQTWAELRRELGKEERP